MRPFQSALVALARSLSLSPPKNTTNSSSIAMASDTDLIIAAAALMLFLLLLLFVLAIRPWRFFLSSPYSRVSTRPIRADDLERPLFTEDIGVVQVHSNLAKKSDLGEINLQVDGNLNVSRSNVLVGEQQISQMAILIAMLSLALTFYLKSSGDSLVLDVISDPSEDPSIGQTLKRIFVASQPTDVLENVSSTSLRAYIGFSYSTNNICLPFFLKSAGSVLNLEVISGLCRGLCYSRESTSGLPLTIGRVPPSDLLLKDNEVSGKHALIDWNVDKSRWELVDVGSLNGTLLNNQTVHHNLALRQRSEPVELATADVITFGATSKVVVQILPLVEHQIPFRVGMASDPMAMWRGGKVLPMEDVCVYQWPLPGSEQFGLFCIFDGHGGSDAAKDVSIMLPEIVADLLSNSEIKGHVLKVSDASEVLTNAFSMTEASLNHQYEGCTATVLLVWGDHNREFFIQCANVGDSACFVNVSGKEIVMTEDHRVTSLVERTRLKEAGRPLGDGEKRLWGFNIGRMLGDKFLKEQDTRFSSKPYVSAVVHIKEESPAFVILASDGLWDVISVKRATQLVLHMKERFGDDSAKKIANDLLNEARNKRTRDNTSLIFLDFGKRTASCNIDL
ncbi:Protein phosphatase 2C 70 [Acorus gramineus]|uniref:protein-serine/threonine phosphatase n=1 Tax=Acorus gramineus TaxID=55184 RepID=A0AAV9BQF6_ACOGR|nr:Protein phosphatase 2C 70 [Acorus gramineus]